MSFDDGALHMDWEEATAAFAAVSPWASPAELQGLLCGAVCADGQAPGDDSWLELIVVHGGEDLAANDATPLLEFRNRVIAGLVDDTLAFPLLLPDDETALAVRLEALALWCGGFLSGFGLRGGNTDGLDEDAVDFLEDLSAVAQVDDDTDASEAAEGHYAEVSEYVRMGALLLLASIQARAVDALVEADPETPLH